MIHHITGKDASQYQSIFFDFDGTLAESGKGCVDAVRYMFSAIGMEENDESRLLKFVGPPIKHHLMDAYGFSLERADYAYQYFREYYLDKGVKSITLYGGIIDALTAIKQSGKTLYVATAKTTPMARQLIERFELQPFFDDIFGAYHEKGVASKTQVLQDAVRRLGGVPKHAVMVGDRYHDIEGAKAIGIDTIGVLYGYGDYAELNEAGCDFLTDSVSDLALLLGGRS